MYATKYVDPSNPDLARTDDELQADYLGHVRTIFPGLRDDEISRRSSSEPVSWNRSTA